MQYIKCISNFYFKLNKESIKFYQKGKREGLREGIEEGEIKEKQEILIRQLSKKFGLNDKEKKLIKSIKDKDKLNKALYLILDANIKEEVLNVISKS